MKDITNIIFNGRIRTVSDNAFYNLTNLRYIRFRFADSLKTIGYNAFMGCTSLTDVYFDGTPAQWQTVTVQSGNSAITNATMHYSAGTCGGSLKWSLEDGTLSIYGTGAMTNWNSPTATPWANVASFVERIHVGSGVHSIGTYAFASCNACKSVTIEAGPSVIGANAFFTRNSLEHMYYNGTQEQWNGIDIKSGNAPMTSRKQPLQGKCGVQASWKISNNTLTITGSGAMTDYTETLAPWDDLQECFNKVVIDGPTNVGAYAFFLMDDIEEVTLYPSVVDSIRAKAFYGCTKLKSVSGLSRISTIQTQAFAHCTSLTGNSLSATAYVADDAFFDCPKFLCTVTFDLNGRGSPKPLDQVVPKGRKITEPGSPSAQDWIFTGWYRNPDTQSYYPFNFDTDTVTSDMTLYAGWREDTLPVSFVSNGGSGVMYPVFVLRGGTLVLPENAFNPPAGKAFSGWKVNDEASLKQPGDAITVTADVTVTAQWYGPYTVSFQKGIGSGTMNAIQVTPKGNFFVPNCEFTPPVGAVFSSWLNLSDNIILQPGDLIVVRNDLILKAQYQGPFTVTFDPVGGTGTMAAVTVGYGETYTLPECGFTPPAGKRFGNWYVEMGDSTTLLWPRYTLTVTQNMTLKPDWQVARATFKANGGWGILNPVDMLPDSSGYITLPECSLNPPDGMMFAGWLVGNTVYQPGQRAPIYGNTDVLAQWTIAHYNVSYDKNGGSGSMASFTTQGDTFSLPDCGFTPPAGMQFAYWIVPAAVTNYKLYYPGQTVQINANTTVQAIWTIAPPSSVTVSFAPGDGSGSMPSLTVPYNQPFVLPECSFTPPAGCVFSRWNFNYGYHNPGEEATLTADTTITANYRQIEQYTVLFDARWHGTAPESQTVTEGGYVTDPGPLHVPGYTFNGWRISYIVYDDSDYHWEDIPFDFSQPIDVYVELVDPSNGEITIFADWTEQRYTVTVSASEGGTASIRNDQADWQYGNGIYVEWETQEGWYLDRILMIPENGEPVDVTSPEFNQPNFTVPDCNVVV
ncbi:MAG: InlB B-repeat-containing protein, partial [Clostridia bacterium]|nr:InlB B-repeat-containing protein [Clostridia bacterium]